MLIARLPRMGGLLWCDTLIDAAIFREWTVSMGRKEAPRADRPSLGELLGRR